MKIFTFSFSLLACMLVFGEPGAWAQLTLTGRVTEAGSLSPLVGVSVKVKDKVVGTITDSKGEFELKVLSPPPFTLVFSSVGFQSQEVEVSGSRSDISVALREEAIMGREVIISASRVEESVLQSPVSIERLDIRSIREAPAPSFEAIRNLKGVDMSTQSLTFSNPNTRGFSGNGNLRMVQLVDGMDNQAPGLNFSVANIAGLSELDVESVELLPGAASALYGANAINGILLMNSKSPFLYQGLSAYVKTGIMHADNRVKRYSYEPEATTPFYDVGIRYAKAFNNKLAFKVNFTYLKAKDWQATDYRDQSLSNGYGFNGTEEWNPGYDGVNVYGDPSIGIASFLGQNLGAIAQAFDQLQPLYLGVQQLGGLFAQAPEFPDVTTPAQGYQKVFDDVYGNTTFARRGYKERDLVDYNAYSIKTNASLHYRINENVEAILQANWGLGTTVYTGADRYFIKNFTIGQYKAEVKGSNFFVRGYTTQENSGDTYAVGLAGLGVNDMWTVQNGNVVLNPNYFATYAASLAGSPASLAGILGKTNAALGGGASAAVMTYFNEISKYRNDANAIAQQLRAQPGIGDGRDVVPGSPAFLERLNRVTSTAIPGNSSGVGAKFLERTALYHLEGMYNFNKLIDPKELEIIAGASYRLFDLNSKGTLFYQDESGKEPNITEIGGYVQAQKTIAEILKLTGSVRYDKNNNFKGQFSPRISGVLTLAANHNIRASFQTAFRIPDTQSQFIDLLTPQARLIGGLPQLREKYFAGASVINAKNGQPFQFSEFRPERVISTEVGYKGLIGDALFADVYYYNSVYKDYIVGNNLLVTSGPNAGQAFGMQSNYDKDIKTHGFGLGLDYALPASFTVGANVSNNTLRSGGVGLFSTEMNKVVLEDGVDIGFNTPKYRYSLSFGNRNIARTGWAFNLVWRRQDAFIWNSAFVPNAVKFTTDRDKQSIIPAIGTLDAQVSRKISGIKSILKVGGTNILNKQYTTGWGNPTVGSMYYVSLMFDQLLN